MKTFLLRWLTNVLALLATAFLLPGIWFKTWWACLIAALILGLLNAFVRPVLLFLTLPLNILSLGIFTIFLNAAILFSVGYIIDDLMIKNYSWAIIASLVFSVLSTAMSWLFHERPAFKGRFHLWRF